MVIQASAEDFQLTIVHNNDVHAHFDEVNSHSGECSPAQAAANSCYGGEARRNAFIKDARRRYGNRTLVLDAGDRFTGTLWFNQYKGRAASIFVNKENYDAVCLGNHEFDLGIEGLVPYLQNLSVPVLDANIDYTNEPRLRGLYNATRILTLNGVKVGIIGFITKDTAFISNAGTTVKFLDEVETAKKYSKQLKASGVDVIIGLSHAGYGMDKKIAAEVEDIDVIVGGHSHTFLYHGTPPKDYTETVEGEYPTVITQSSGRKVLVVQAYAWGKYMGFINVTFDDHLDVKNWSGNPVLLRPEMPKDNETEAIIQAMKKPLDEIKKQIVGRTVVKLEGDPIQCRLRECNSGNMIADGMVEYHIDKRESNETWALAPIALFSGGGVRASTEIGDISMGQVLSVMPFGNNVDMIKLKGIHLRQAFEHSVANYDIHDRPGAFFQMSGAHVTYDLSRPPGQRVVSLEMRCLNCTVPAYEPLNDDLIYSILMVDFTIKGGDGFSMISDNLVEQKTINSLDVDVFKTYLAKHTPVYADTEGRIKFVTSNPANTTNCRICEANSSNPANTNNCRICEANFVLLIVMSIALIIYHKETY
ncbi:hypothetical protein DPMN_043238 [Dreissena polymorpha]|uniref:5'-nucleotidase n=2 Tax=Dreissena polymorpha TaxID=45954 RepID=A0A9D4D0Z7_DREPO|nr:hypothetical protein DPMN_043238 [Dreissena polymorpha]